MRSIILFLTFFFLLISCAEENIIKDSVKKPLYPTTIEKIEANELAILRYEYCRRNYFIQNSLNDFGFADCKVSGCQTWETPPPVLQSLSEGQATEMIESFLLLNQAQIGLTSINDVVYVNKDCTVSNSNIYWYFRIPNQKIDSIEVFNTEISIDLFNGKVTWCNGNWYPEIYIPEHFIFSQDEAKSLLIGTNIFSVFLYENVTITQESFNESKVRLVILPIESSVSIELRIAWEITFFAPICYLFYIDVMSGKVLRKESTAI